MTVQKKTIDDRVLNLEYNEEKTQRHLGEIKNQMKATAEDVSDIKNAIIGSHMNGNYGLVHQVNKISDKQEHQENTLLTHQLYFRQIGIAIGSIITILIGLVVAYFKK